MKKILPLLSLSLLLLSGCVDLFDETETLVYGYTDQPWAIRTKATTEKANDWDMKFMSVAISGDEWKDIDHLIYMDLASHGRNGVIYSAQSNVDAFKQFCEKHGDTKKSPIGSFRQITQSDACIYHFFKDFTTLEVTSDQDFDAAHPAGSSLLDIIHYATDSPYRVLRNNYQTVFSDNALTVEVTDDKYLSEFYGEGPFYRQLFNIFKQASDLQPGDLSILGNIYLSFNKLPDSIGPRNIKIKMTADDGTVYDFETVLTFAKIH